MFKISSPDILFVTMQEMKQKIVYSLAEAVGSIWKELQNFYCFTIIKYTAAYIYRWVITNANKFEHWEKVRFFLMDELLDGRKYVSISDPASYEGFARKHLLQPLYEKVSNKIEIIKPELPTISNFETPINLLILALGVKRNYAKIMPQTPLETGWHIAHLISEFRQAHIEKGSKSYKGAHFREYGMSLVPQQILHADHVIVIISGEKKRGLAKQLLSYQSFHSEFPLSII